MQLFYADVVHGRTAVSLEVIARLDKFSTRTRREVAYLGGAAFGHRRAQRFVLLSHARTGSNYVVNGLTTSPAIRMYRELFADHNRVHGQGFAEIMETLRTRQPRSVRVVGFKLFYYHLTDAEWAELAKDTRLRILHLTRRNRLRTIVSLAIAEKTDRWTRGLRDLPLAERRVALDPETLARRLDEIAEREKAARDRLRAHEMLEVTYEDLVLAPVSEFARLGAFLGVEDIDPRKIVLARQNPEPLAELIENLDEVADCLRETRYAADLTDAS